MAGGASVLDHAVRHASVPVVFALLQSRASVAVPDQWGRTPLHTAAAAGRGELVSVLLGGDGSTESLIPTDGAAAIQMEDLTLKTPLHDAATACSLSSTTMIIRAGANVVAVDEVGSHPLHHAAEAGNMDAISALIQASADVNAANQLGNTPLHRAARAGQLEAARALLNAGADPTVENEAGDTPAEMNANSNDIFALFAGWELRQS